MRLLWRNDPRPSDYDYSSIRNLSEFSLKFIIEANRAYLQFYSEPRVFIFDGFVADDRSMIIQAGSKVRASFISFDDNVHYLININVDDSED